MSEQLVNTYNYLVPAAGTTRSYRVTQNFAPGDIKHCDFRNMALDGVSFVPSGVLVDNTRGTGDCVITIIEFAWRIVVPAGTMINMPYPAPYNQTATIEGEGDITVVFVDYPVIPFISGSGGGVMSGVTRVLAGDNISVDNTDPAFPIISATGGGGGGGGAGDLVVSMVGMVQLVEGGTQVKLVPAAKYDPDGLVDANNDIAVPPDVTYVEFNISALNYGTQTYDLSLVSGSAMIYKLHVLSEAQASGYANYFGALMPQIGTTISPMLAATNGSVPSDDLMVMVTLNIKMRK